MIKYVFSGRVKKIEKEESSYRVELHFGRDETIIFFIDELLPIIKLGNTLGVAGSMKIDPNNSKVAYMY